MVAQSEPLEQQSRALDRGAAGWFWRRSGGRIELGELWKTRNVANLVDTRQMQEL